MVALISDAVVLELGTLFMNTVQLVLLAYIAMMSHRNDRK